MTAIAKSAKRIDVVGTPLQVQMSLGTADDVPLVQDYDSATGIYTPDYTLAHLTLVPRVGVIDKDGVLPSGSVVSKLTDISWTVIEGGEEKAITAGDPDFAAYSIGAAGTPDAGKLTISRNFPLNGAATFVFRAKLLDSKLGQVHQIQMSQTVECLNSRQAFSLELDCPTTVRYNPLRSPAKRAVEAALMLGREEADPARTAYRWEKKDEGAWRAVDPANPLDYDVEVGASGNTAEVACDLMGESLEIRCVALYDSSDTGSPDPASNGGEVASKSVLFMRKLPPLECDYGYVPSYVNAGLSALRPCAMLSDAAGNLDTSDPRVAGNLRLLWRMAANKATSALSYRQVGEGPSPTIPSALLTSDYGAMLELEVEDAGSLCAWADSDGKILTDSDGAVLLIK